MKSLYSTLLALLTPVLCSSCSEEDYTYPDVYTTFACLHTDEQGTGTLLSADDGKQWHIGDTYQPTGLTPDSLYRVISKFDQAPGTEASDSIIRPYMLMKTISPIAVPEAEITEKHTDPVAIQSIWKSGNYLNLILKIRVKDKRHLLGFIDNGVEIDSEGKRKLILTLYHDRMDDVEGFDQTYYLSVPLYPYRNKLQKGDTILFRLNTYKEGNTSRIFTY